MSNKKDFYEVLGLNKTANVDEIKKAYRKLANKYHPDKNPDDPSSEEKFKEVKRAYEILSDESMRASYDQFGHSGVEQTASRHYQDEYADVFKRAFDAQMRQQRTMQLQVGITLAHSIKGGPIAVDVPSFENCAVCDGTGSKTKAKTMCNGCGGSGHSTGQMGGMRFTQVCGMCGGAGQMVSDPCGVCGGAGQVRKTIQREVDVPAGVNTGDAIRMGFTDHEVVLIFVVQAHPTFMRDGNDLIRRVEVDAVTATLGGKVSVEDVFGSSLVVTIPAGTQPMQNLRLSGKGVSRNGQTGNMYCQIVVKIPTTLTQQQRELYEQLRNTNTSQDVK